jgi:hypothetical protein
VATQTMTEKEAYLATFEREFQTTLRLLKNYPADPWHAPRSARGELVRLWFNA